MNRPHFYLKSWKEKNTLVSMWFNYDRLSRSERLVYSTKISVPVKLWNKDKERISNTSKFPQGAFMNAMLNKYQNECEKIYYRYLSEGKIKSLTVGKFKEELDIVFGRHKIKSVSLVQYFENFIAWKKKEGTVTHILYRTEFRRLKKFFEYKKQEYDFDDIDLKFLEEYKAFSFEVLNLSSVTVHKSFVRLKTVLRRAYNEKVHNNDAFETNLFQVTKIESGNTYLNMEELSRLYHFEYDDPKYTRIRDIFVLACFTGVRVSDWKKINHSNFVTENNVDMFVLTTEKKNRKVAIPVHPVVMAIIEKYNWDLPTHYTDPYINRMIKECCRMAGLNAKVEKIDTKGGKMKRVPYEKWQIVSTHTARRSFATNAYLADIDPVDICKITGHKKISQLLEYIKASALQSAVKVSKNDFFKGDGFLRVV